MALFGANSIVASSKPVSTIRVVLPLTALGFALIANAVWIVFLSYCLWKLI
jgi:hypothetical protein